MILLPGFYMLISNWTHIGILFDGWEGSVDQSGHPHFPLCSNEFQVCVCAANILPEV